jgi:hypothetical protein
MRIKIIAVNALIVALMGLLSFLLVRSSLSSAAGNKDQLALDAQNDVNGASASLQLDGLRTERWLSGVASEQATLDALTKASASARGAAAQSRCTDIVNKMKNEPMFDKNVPTFVAIIDPTAKIVGRNNTNISSGDSIGTYPGLKKTLSTGQSGSDVWYETKDRVVASYVVVRDATGAVVGGLVATRPLNDALSHASDATTGKALDVVVPNGDGFDIVGNSAAKDPALDAAVGAGAKDMLKNAFAHQQTDHVREGEIIVAAGQLTSFGDGKRALLVASAPASLIQDPTALVLLPIFGGMAVGLMLVVVAGWLLGNYITRPINMLEEGLLAILNGQADKRFELDHAELGGLAFRIDQLLNQLMGVEEDTTDAEGRVSQAPSAAHFNDAMSVDDKRGEGAVDPGVVAQLAAEPAAQYYGRIYREYINAKRSLGEQTDHITEQAFVTRIQGMEQEAAQRSGKPVRYQVQARGREVVLIAVPLP